MSNVIDLDVRPFRVVFREPVRSGRDWIRGRDVAIVRLVDDEGRVGLGESFEVPHTEAVATARSWAVERTPTELLGTGGPWSLGVLPRRLSAALDCAAADLAARQTDVALARLLAGERALTRVRVNALLVAPGPGEGPVRAARALVADGYATLKLKLGGGQAGSPEPWWADLLAAIRVAVGSDVAIRLDLNGALSPEAASAWLPTVAHLALEYVEQPIGPEHGPDRLAALRDTGVPIAADESVTDVDSALELLGAGCDVLVVKPASVGGLTAASDIIEAATDQGVPVTLSTLYETGVGLAAALHLAATLPQDRAHGLATAALIADDPVTGLPSVTRGSIEVPGPGLGVTLA